MIGSGPQNPRNQFGVCKESMKKINCVEFVVKLKSNLQIRFGWMNIDLNILRLKASEVKHCTQYFNKKLRVINFDKPKYYLSSVQQCLIPFFSDKSLQQAKVNWFYTRNQEEIYRISQKNQLRKIQQNLWAIFDFYKIQKRDSAAFESSQLCQMDKLRNYGFFIRNILIQFHIKVLSIYSKKSQQILLIIKCSIRSLSKQQSSCGTFCESWICINGDFIRK
ncbi:hypothetical protein ABPG74_009733 [Tetrahymena malaccensis]